MKATTAALMAVFLAGTLQAASMPQQRKTPYWGSLSAGQARMRTGPGRNYPVNWFYQRQGLPVQVVETYPGWRKVRDPDGTSGWMIGNLVSDQRTGMVKDAIADLRASPNADAKVVWRAEPGVVGRLSHCAEGWCKLDVQGRGGFVEETKLWGVDPDENFD
jgi:SH3-like domain-containing protein